ncbi:hypothetical protein [Massilia sp. LC238]|uniref:hypothetical protein n=1 Tax=Massilia sp. LC238 TaxID=1502852 RepID=UPI0004E3D51A|nr:hypothetical protein [Massilia sp. LC238]KFC61901.1 hypothetical protein FG94_04941 [Massilia sp. LC238]
MSETNPHHRLDAIKYRLSSEVLSRFPLSVIREHARANLLRWKAQDSWGPTYEEWLAILDSNDDKLLRECMESLDANSNRLRQSIPYVGMLPQDVVLSIYAEFPR